LLQLLVTQEQTDKAFGYRSLGQLGEAGGLNLDGLVTAEVGGFLNGLDGFDRRRIVRACLAGHVRLGSLERHHLLDGVELELFQLRLTLGLEVQLTGKAQAQRQDRKSTRLNSSHVK